MEIYKTIVSLIVAVAISVSSGFGAKPLTDEEKREQAELIRNMIFYYSYYTDRSERQITEALARLKEIEPDNGRRWQEVMNCWAFTRSGLTVNNDILPDGLDDGDGLCIVILGYQLNADGSIAPELEGRLKTALACAEKYPACYVLCTGGGTALGNPYVTEAGQMAAWLNEHGLDEKRIIIEDQSKTTGQNAIFSHAILKAQYPSVKQIAIVSSDYHIPWGTMLFEAELILSEGTERDIAVVSNAAFPANQYAIYPFSYQGAGLLEIAGYTYDAMSIYSGSPAIPALN